LLLYSYVQRNISNIVNLLPLILFDYCSVHVSTVISHVSQQFRFLVFFIITQWVVSVHFPEWIEKMYKTLNGLHHHHQHRARSYSCVNLGWLNGVTQYWSRNLCGFAYHRSTICLHPERQTLYDQQMNEIAAFFGNYPLGVFTKIRNHVDKYVITKHYYQLMPLSLATVNLSLKRQ
ncbi:hypothetical protein T07_3744, partial [Trichinella nelsoni]